MHIPKEYYHYFLQPILRILFDEDTHTNAADFWTDKHDFLNLSITPMGCSLMCSRTLVDEVLRPSAEQFNSLIQPKGSKTKLELIDTSKEDYVVVQVDGQGLDAGQRVLDLTGPLAMAGISIFFITTYFSDYVLVPAKARHTVITTLQQRGFVFSQEAEAYVSQLSPTLQNHTQAAYLERPHTSSSSGSEHFRPTSSSSAPTTPPARDIPELQIRTFTKLKQHNIEPNVDRSLRLINCASSREASDADMSDLKDDLLRILLATNLTKSVSSTNDVSTSFLAFTLTSNEPPSLLLEERLMPRLVSASSLLASRSEEDILTPIILDLRNLGWNATGIVGGVAGQLSQHALFHELSEEATEDVNFVEVSFLSSAKAGSIIVQAERLDRCLKALQNGMRREIL